MLVRVLAIVWLGMALLAIGGAAGFVWLTVGYEAMIDSLSPRDVIGYLTIVIALLPPVLLLTWAWSWRRRRR